MENKNINTQAAGNAGRNWAIAGVVAIALILGVGYISRTHTSPLNDISPAAGEAAATPGAPSFDGNMPPQPTPAPGVE
ncbi:MAG: hypothetical protein IT560_05260 [Alphaproteobacteria bacterium]|nr:hypothetical protein [Alphaproteobacteria bacterium]